MIKKEGNKYCLYSKDGSKKLGCHATRAEAKSQEAAVNISKGRAAGHKIPRVGKASGGPVSAVKKAASKVKGTGALMTKKEKEDLLGMVKTTLKKKAAKKK